MKKVILVVSFGTGYPDAEQSCIRPVEDALRTAFPDCDVQRAYTSRRLLAKLRAQETSIESEEEAVARLRREGRQVYVVPTHIIPGGEYQKTAAAAQELPLSEPLLCDDADLDWMAGLLGALAVEEGQPLLMMGHGTDCAADEIYLRLQEKLPGNAFLACAEGQHTLETILPRLDALPDRRITLAPLMLVAGKHARTGLAGAEATSWKSVLEDRGFKVHVRMQGLGALKAVQQRFVLKAGKILR